LRLKGHGCPPYLCSRSNGAWAPSAGNVAGALVLNGLNRLTDVIDTTESESVSPPPKGTALIVEDEGLAADLVESMLRGLGYNSVVHTQDVASAYASSKIGLSRSLS